MISFVIPDTDTSTDSDSDSDIDQLTTLQILHKRCLSMPRVIVTSRLQRISDPRGFLNDSANPKNVSASCT
jgi:hypothetical protein